MREKGKYKCKKCGDEAMEIDYTPSCGQCEFNGFYLDHEMVESWGMTPSEDDYYYDESLKKKAECELDHEIIREQTYESGHCRRGAEMVQDGCWYIECHSCHNLVEIIPLMHC